MDRSETIGKAPEAWIPQIIKALKPPMVPDDLDWQASSFFKLRPVYDATALGPEHAYLRTFHERWSALRQSKRPEFQVDLGPMLSSGADDLQEAELWGFASWTLSSGLPPRDLGTGLPVHFRAWGEPGLANHPHCDFDPLMDSLRLGTWTPGLKEKSLEYHIHASDVSHAGGSAVEEISLALRIAEAYRQNLTPDEFKAHAGNWVIHLGCGTSFWLEMAKFRAMRILWMNFLHLHGVADQPGKIFGETSTFTWSHQDPDGNLLRHTSSLLSALMGGADSILIQPHTWDPGTGKDATRLAVNIGLLALEEAHLDQAFDPASGAYLLEILTHELASAAWSQFQSSARNDLFKDILDGNIQKPILETAKEFLSRVVSGEQVLVGVNKHQSPLARKSPPMPVQKAVELPEFTPLEPVFADA